MTFKRSYFDQSPEICQPGEGVPPAVEFHWKLSDIVNAAIRAGFRIERLEEFWVEHEDKKTSLLPTDFLLVAAKEKPS